jgi:hypothetical protein
MVTLHPAFDPITKTWFVDQYEAPTLRQLQEQIGKVKFRDHYPNGYNYTNLQIQLLIKKKRRASKRCSTLQTLSNNVQEPAHPKKPDDSLYRAERGHANKYREEIIAMVSNGYTFGQIGLRLSIPKNSVAGIMYRHRRKHDKNVQLAQ